MSYDFHGKWEKKTGHNSPMFAHNSDKGDNRFLNLVGGATMGSVRSYHTTIVIHGRLMKANESNKGVRK